MFDKVLDRRGTGCFKYDALKVMYGRDDLIPLWVADMDFAVAEEISSALANRLKHPVFGYNFPNAEFHEVIRNWELDRYLWDTSSQRAISTPSLMTALAIAILSQTNPGDNILIQTPVYPPFHSSVKEHGRYLLTNPLLPFNGHYEVDWTDFEAKAAQAKMFILCNPHNPVGKVFSRDELARMHDICKRYGLLIFSDEIHADIVYSPHKHVPIATLGADIVITGVSPAKSFNLAGMATAMMFAPDNHIADALEKLNENLHTFMGNSFGITAFTAAYGKAGSWLDDLVLYLKGNRDYLAEYIASELPKLQMADCEGTFLAWLDCRELEMADADLMDFFTNKARVALNPGTAFGIQGSGFVRVNFACPRTTLQTALTRINDALKDR